MSQEEEEEFIDNDSSDSESEEDKDYEGEEGCETSEEEEVEEAKEEGKPPPKKGRQSHNSTRLQDKDKELRASTRRSIARSLEPPILVTNRKDHPSVAPPLAAATVCSTSATGKRKSAPVDAVATTDDGEPAEKREKYAPPEIAADADNVTIRDFSQPVSMLIKDKFILGSRHTAQVGQVNIIGTPAFEALIITREAPREIAGKDARRPFRFNMPATLILSLRNALTEIITRSSRDVPMLECFRGG